VRVPARVTYSRSASVGRRYCNTIGAKRTSCSTRGVACYWPIVWLETPSCSKVWTGTMVSCWSGGSTMGSR